ncbi:hypothetical protein [Microvirga lotononidis]|uniref:Uncharacterized protein n=1 Tax=Microvirga lotononidis TaxID=864069 RepID=I4YTR6_9HYPH|nr:hypothetical protein [Microvirga lotononidis]EIM27358.1 hypothetical protein MicloDRAFT_00039200 [Microvirga lotononidis]WQO28474.1 hypothetical protein U0023_05140 [Microvirga lotononidis]
MAEEKEDEQGRFEAMLAQALGDDEKALVHRAAKDLRKAARTDAVGAKASFELNRNRPAKPRRRQPKRQG